MWHIASICYTMSPCCTLPDVVDIDAVKKANGPGSEAGWQRYAPCPCSTPSGTRSQTLFQEAFVLNLSISHRSRTAGFTFIEMLLVFVIMGIMLSITVKSVRGTWVASSRRSASREVTSYLFRTRAIAIQQSRRSEEHTSELQSPCN